MMKGPKNEINNTKHRQVTSGASTNAALRCHHLKKLKQCSFNPTERNFSVEATSENKSLAQSRRATDEEGRVGATNASDAINSISAVEVLPEPSNNGSVKATSKSNRTTVSSKSSNARRILLELEAMKKQQLAAARRTAEIEMRILAEELQIAKLEDESARTKQVANQETELAPNGIQLKPRQPQKVTKQLQPCKGPQKSYLTFKTSSTSTKPLTGTELRGQSALSQKDIIGVTSKESRPKSNKKHFWSN